MKKKFIKKVTRLIGKHKPDALIIKYPSRLSLANAQIEATVNPTDTSRIDVEVMLPVCIEQIVIPLKFTLD